MPYMVVDPAFRERIILRLQSCQQYCEMTPINVAFLDILLHKIGWQIDPDINSVLITLTWAIASAIVEGNI